MRNCPFCNGELVEIDRIGTEGCELCGTTFSLLPMKREDKNEQPK